MDRYTILVVEDDPVIRTQLQTLLQGAGYNTASPADFFDVAGQVQRILILLMFFGRVGGLTLIYAAISVKQNGVKLPLEKITVG